MRNKPELSAPVPARGDLVETEILDVGERDKCFGRLENGLGLFVQGPVAVGDRVQARVYKVKKQYAEARLEKVLTPSPHRCPPTCTHFGVCGGCKWQHVTYEEQCRIKRKQVVDALQHVGGFETFTTGGLLPAPERFHYRNKIEFTFCDRRFLLPGEMDEGAELTKPVDFALGFHAPRRYNKVVDIDTCYLATPLMSEVLNLVKAFALERKLTAYSTETHEGYLRNLVVRTAHSTGECMVNLVTSTYEEALMQELDAILQETREGPVTTFVNNITSRKNKAAVGDRERVVRGPGFIREKLGDLEFVISANSFFQTNTVQAERLYDLARSMAHLEKDDVVYDLYAGTGTIALYLAGACKKVLGIEVVSSAVEDARKNARQNGVENAFFEEMDLKDIKSIREDLPHFGLPDVVLVDPPRAGVHPKVVQTILNIQPRRVVYVSCNPASLARDAAALCEEGAYRLEEVVPIDMFPHTNHIESVARLERV